LRNLLHQYGPLPRTSRYSSNLINRPPLTHQNPTMAASIILPSARQRALRLMGSIGSHSSTCPCHSNPSHVHLNPRLQTLQPTRRKYATPVDSSKEYAFEMAVSSIRFGEGCTLEVGMDVQNMGIKKVLVLTDKTVGKLLPMRNTIQSLEQHGVTYEIFDNCRVEPKDYSYCPSWEIVILIG
jgi:hydroxyacid-oxoacid transhydrogenase